MKIHSLNFFSLNKLHLHLFYFLCYGQNGVNNKILYFSAEMKIIQMEISHGTKRD